MVNNLGLLNCREAVGNDPFTGPALLGVVEIYETLVGGKTKGKGHGYKSNKIWVAGAIHREGKVRLERITGVKQEMLHGFIERTVHNKAEAIYTDEFKSYLGIEDHNTRHEAVNHSMERWVIGDAHTNSIEVVWALFNRSNAGAFH